MSDQDEVTVVQESSSNAGKWLLLLLAAIYVAGSLYFLIDMRGSVGKLAQEQAASQKQVADLSKRMQSAEADDETLGQQVGMTKKEMAQPRGRAAAASSARRKRVWRKQQKQQISAVSGEVAGVKTDVGGVKTDVASTKADLEATKAKLQSTIGDLGVQSGLIANTRGDLEVLKHKGDRNYYEFTLIKGAKPQPVSTVGLQLKKTDMKRGKFTLNVTSDDKTIEKKGSQRQRADPVLQRTRSHAVRTGGLDRGQEQSDRLLEHSEGCADAGHRRRNRAHVSGRSCSGRHRAADDGDLWVVLLGMRLSGKREVGQMTPFDLTLLLLLLSNAVQNAMTGPDTSFWAESWPPPPCCCSITSIAELSGGNRRFRKLVQGQPSLLVHDGKIIAAHMAREHVSLDELHASLREHGIAGLHRGRAGGARSRWLDQLPEVRRDQAHRLDSPGTPRAAFRRSNRNLVAQNRLSSTWNTRAIQEYL